MNSRTSKRQPTIRAYRPTDDASLAEICLLTGAPGGHDASTLYDNPRLLAEIYVGPYVWHSRSLALVAEDDSGVAGYVVGTADTTAFEAACEAAWWPRLRHRYPLPDPADASLDAKLVRYIHAPPVTDGDIATAYPAHLHIDLLPHLQGHGCGRRLLTTFLGALTATRAGGVHLGVGLTNYRAIAFYRSMGFHELNRSPDALVMGRRPDG